MTKESYIIKEIYSLIKEAKVPKDYTKEIVEIDKKMEEIKKAKEELIDMRARKEIDNEEFTRQKEKYEEFLVNLENKKSTYFADNKDLASDDLTTFYKKVRRMILSDEESLFRVLGSIVEVIYVERFEKRADQRALLHFKLKIRYKVLSTVM